MATDLTIYDPTGVPLWTRSVPIGLMEQWTLEDEDHPLGWGGDFRAPYPVRFANDQIARIEVFAARTICSCRSCRECREISADLVGALRAAPPNSTIEVL